MSRDVWKQLSKRSTSIKFLSISYMLTLIWEDGGQLTHRPSNEFQDVKCVCPHTRTVVLSLFGVT